VSADKLEALLEKIVAVREVKTVGIVFGKRVAAHTCICTHGAGVHDQGFDEPQFRAALTKVFCAGGELQIAATYRNKTTRYVVTMREGEWVWTSVPVPLQINVAGNAGKENATR
jgi:hypothetical protein